MAEIQPYTKISNVVRYAKSRFTQYRRDEAYRFYVTELLRSVSENTAKMGGGRIIALNYTEYMEKALAPKDIRSGDEIALDIITRAGLKMEN